MRERLNYYKAAPDGVKALRQVGTYLKTSGPEAGLLHLIYLHASQINAWNRTAVGFRTPPAG
jgi:hypothetical protein